MESRLPRLAPAIMALSLSATDAWGGDGCDWSKITPRPADPYQDCVTRADSFRTQYAACVAGTDILDGGRLEAALVRREQFKLVFSQMLFNVARLPPTSAVFESSWAGLRTSWVSRLKADPPVLRLDEDPRLRTDRCALHQILGLACAGLPAFDALELEKANAAAQARNRAGQRGLAPSLVFDLLEAVTMVQSTKPAFLDIFKGREYAKNREAAARDVQNYVFGYYPELAADPTLYARLHLVLIQNGTFDRVESELHAAGGVPTLGARHEIVSRLLIEELKARPLDDALVFPLERDFAKAQGRLEDALTAQLSRGLGEPTWLFNQDYLLVAALRGAGRWAPGRQAPLFQTLLCHNQIGARDFERTLGRAEHVATGALLLTGVGSLLDLGAIIGTTCTISSFAVLNALSAEQIYRRYLAVRSNDALFAMRGVEYSDVRDAGDDLRGEIPWAILNVALIGPSLALPRLAAARSAALAAHRLDDAATFERLTRLVHRFGQATGLGLGAYGGYEGIATVRGLLGETSK